MIAIIWYPIRRILRFCFQVHVGLRNNLTKSYKNYLQNTQHMVLRNRPTLIIGTERLACLNSPPWRFGKTMVYSCLSSDSNWGDPQL